jgi:hypothetical protein
MSTDLETKDTSAQLEELRAEEAALAAAFKDELASEKVSIPLLKIVQGTTKEPPEGANLGDFFNPLTGEVFGPEVEFVVAGRNKGRFYIDSDDNDRPYVGQGDVCTWADAADGRWEGLRFDEIPEAEEQYRARANAGDIEWGSGPPI